MLVHRASGGAGKIGFFLEERGQLGTWIGVAVFEQIDRQVSKRAGRSEGFLLPPPPESLLLFPSCTRDQVCEEVPGAVQSASVWLLYAGLFLVLKGMGAQNGQKGSFTRGE